MTARHRIEAESASAAGCGDGHRRLHAGYGRGNEPEDRNGEGKQRQPDQDRCRKRAGGREVRIVIRIRRGRRFAIVREFGSAATCSARLGQWHRYRQCGVPYRARRRHVLHLLDGDERGITARTAHGQPERACIYLRDSQTRRTPHDRQSHSRSSPIHLIFCSHTVITLLTSAICSPETLSGVSESLCQCG